MATEFRLLEIPDVKPAWELIDGLLEQKVSPRAYHSLVQAALSRLLPQQSERVKAGFLGSELDVDVTLAGRDPMRLVPDLAFYPSGSAAIPQLAKNAIPQRAPAVVFEIASPEDEWRSKTRRKIEVYLADGCEAVVVVNPMTRSIAVHEPSATREFASNEILAIAALPDLSMTVAEVFSDIDRLLRE